MTPDMAISMTPAVLIKMLSRRFKRPLICSYRSAQTASCELRRASASVIPAMAYFQAGVFSGAGAGAQGIGVSTAAALAHSLSSTY